MAWALRSFYHISCMRAAGLRYFYGVFEEKWTRYAED